MSGAVRRRLALTASVAGAAIVALDGTVLLAAQPSLRRELGAGLAQVQWAGTAYLVAVAALLVLAGRLGDRHGHVRLLVTGTLGFGAASAAIAFAPTVGWLIGLRAVQGVFAALLQPATLALLRLAYPGDRLARPVAVRTAAIGVAAAAGPVLGGFLVAHLGWRSVFALNVPLALATAALALSVRTPPAPSAPRSAAGRLDVGGAALIALALAALTGTLSQAPDRGWVTAPTLLGLLTAAAAAAAFAAHERRAGHPIVPGAVIRSTPVTASMAMLLVTAAGMFGALFSATFRLQDLLGLDALTGGLRALPLTAFMVAGAPAAGAALGRYGARRTAVTGVLLAASGIAALSFPLDGWTAGVGFAVLGAGFSAVMVTATGTVVGDAPAGYAGVVGGLKQTAVNIGTALGIAVAAGLMPAAAAATPAAAPGQAVDSGMFWLAALTALAVLPAALMPASRPSTRETKHGDRTASAR
ncbi:MFS transporter [Streptosporangium sp. NPDC004379]|uniref:MFS transporter n=1 Tax=Streptosporangium sp. NPDC004379 TaxID=3366189 RepID=UPI0036961F00